MLQVHTYRAKPPPATPDILKCILELLLAVGDSPDLRQMHAKVCHVAALPKLPSGCPAPKYGRPRTASFDTSPELLLSSLLRELHPDLLQTQLHTGTETPPLPGSARFARQGLQQSQQRKLPGPSLMACSV